MTRVAITGTKGKTTVTLILDQVLRNLGRPVLRVDTTGVYMNGKLKFDKDQSVKYHGLVPTKSPGRFFHYGYETFDENFDAVLECTLGCSSIAGLGYYRHDIGVFTNVFSDHIGSSRRIRNREDIAQAKKFIFEEVRNEGYAICNTDDSLVAKMANEALAGRTSVKAIGFGLTPKPKHKLEQPVEAYVTVENGDIVIKRDEGKDVLFPVKDLVWTFEGGFTPSIYNALAIAATLYAYVKGATIPEPMLQAFRSSYLEPEFGRLVRLRSAEGIEILADYAHEKESLQKVAELARSLVGSPNANVIGVVRMAWDRTDELIKETGRAIADFYDAFIVYDKIDGFWRNPVPYFTTTSDGKRVGQKVGRVSSLLSDALATRNSRVETVLREDEAIARAAAIAKPGDVVVVIVNDDIHRSLDFIREKFRADFVRRSA